MDKRLLLASGLLALIFPAIAAAQGLPAVPIPQNPLEQAAVDDFIGAPAKPKPLRSFNVPEHSF